MKKETEYKIYVADKIGKTLVKYLKKKDMETYRNCFEVIENVLGTIVKLIAKDKDKPDQISTLNFLESSIKERFKYLRNKFNIDSTDTIFDIKTENIKRITVGPEQFFTVKLNTRFDMEQIQGLKAYLVSCFHTENIIIHSDDIDFV